jgi:hypothetical protein
MPETEGERLQRKLDMLRSIHPNYSDADLKDSLEKLTHYFDLVWRLFVTMRDDGRLDRIFDDEAATSYNANTKAEDSPDSPSSKSSTNIT